MGYMTDPEVSPSPKKSGYMNDPVVGEPSPKLVTDIPSNILGAIYEPLAKIGTSMIAKPVSEVAGLAATGYELATGNKNDANSPEQFKHEVQNQLTYEPTTVAGASKYNPLNAIPNAIGQGISWAGNKLAENPKMLVSPVLGIKDAYDRYINKVAPEQPDNSSLEGMTSNAIREGFPQALGILGTKYGTGIAQSAQDKFAQLKADLATQKGANSLLDQAFQKSKEAGYKFAPSEASPSLINNAIEGLGGKTKTQQIASIKNTFLTDKLARQDLNIPPDVPLSVDAYAAVRSQAAPAYEAIRGTGTVMADKTYMSALDAIKAPYENAAKGFPNAKPNPVIEVVDALKSPSFDASAAIDMIKELRGLSDKSFKGGDGSLGSAYRNAANVLDDQISRHLVASGQPKAMIDDYHAARTMIAKSYAFQKATNLATGDIIPSKIGSELSKGKPLTGNLELIGQAAQFEKSMQARGKIGGVPSIAPVEAGMGGTIAAIMHNPVYLGALTVPGAARSLALSDFYQNRMVNPPTYQPSMLQNASPYIAEAGTYIPPAFSSLADIANQNKENKYVR